MVDEFYEYSALNLVRHWAACSNTPFFQELQTFHFSRWFLALQHVRLTSHEDIIYITSRTDDRKIGSNAIEEMSFWITLQVTHLKVIKLCMVIDIIAPIG